MELGSAFNSLGCKWIQQFVVAKGPTLAGLWSTLDLTISWPVAEVDNRPWRKQSVFGIAEQLCLGSDVNGCRTSLAMMGCSLARPCKVRRYGATRNLKHAAAAPGFPGKPKKGVLPLGPGMTANNTGWPGRTLRP